jgi:hypothetical protein
MARNHNTTFTPGARIGSWIVIERRIVLKSNGAKKGIYLCRCVCGRTRELWTYVLRRGTPSHCGCLTPPRTPKPRGRHQYPEYRVWTSMRSRCMSPSHQLYPHYGARGIKVCDRWGSFPVFFSDMGERPSKDYSIERKDNDLGYSPENCVWATRTEQCRNRRSTRKLELSGITLSLTGWAEKTGIPASVISRRLKRGLSLQQAIDLGRGVRGKHFKIPAGCTSQQDPG